MKLTVKRRSFSMTQESERQIAWLCEQFMENPSKIFSRALQMLYYAHADKAANQLKATEEKLNDN